MVIVIAVKFCFLLPTSNLSKPSFFIQIPWEWINFQYPEILTKERGNDMRILSLILTAAMLVSFVGCAPATSNSPTEDLLADYDTVSEQIYNDTLGGFYAAYTQAKEQENTALRYAYMAVAEAKLLSAAVMLPLSASGGNYALSRVAPHTISQVLWGNDDTRYQNALVCTQLIQNSHRQEMENKWNELRGSGTYQAWARDYLQSMGYTLKDTYTISYAADPQTWDALATAYSGDAAATVNTYDVLCSYDGEEVLRPVLAESWEKGENEDGKVTYTFHIRSGLNWTDSQGRIIAPVRADDFVAGMQHVLDAAAGLEYLLQGVIENADAYIQGAIMDFSQVGVKALDDTTLVYTLETDVPYFLTMMGYAVFAPLCRQYYVSCGGKFGEEYDASAPDYVYGTSFDRIAYCGAYLVTNATAENTIVFRANPNYWNAENQTIQEIVWLYNDGTDATKAYTDVKSGVTDFSNMTAAAMEIAAADGLKDTYCYITYTGATSYMAFYNLNRIALQNADDGGAVSQKSREEANRTSQAMQNVHFRRAISFAVNRSAYQAQSVGETLKLTSLRNGFTPGNFVQLSESVTLEWEGRTVQFPEGTYYGEIVQAQLDADGAGITVWQNGSSDGFDGWYQPEQAMKELLLAMEELDIPISADNPIYLDLPYFASNEIYANKVNAYKQSLESALQGLVKITLVPCTSRAMWRYAGYDIHYGYEANYDIYDLSGWGPDYGDPSTYLDTFLPDYAGYITKNIGLF